MPVGYTPIFRIDLDGTDITSRFNDRVLDIQVNLTAGGGNPDTCSITLDDRDWRLASPTVGRKLEIFLGYREVGLAQQNVFEVNAVEYKGPPRAIKITGTAAGLMGSLKAPAIKDHDTKTLKEIVETIARAGGGEAMVEQGLGEIKVPFLNQTASPLHLLQELERRYGAMAKFHNGKLAFLPRDSNESVGGLTLPTLLLRPEHLAEWSVRHSERGTYSGVRASYIDAKTHQPVWLEEANPKAPTDSDGKVEANPYRMPRPHKDESEARAAMRAMVSTLNRSRGEATFVLSKGDPWVRDHQFILMTDMRDGVNGAYEADTVTHTYTKGAGLGTRIIAKPPGGDGGLEAGAASDEAVYSPSAGSKLGAKYVPPVFDRV